MKKLTLKEQAFIKETLETRNPAEAIRRVYDLGSKGGSKTKKQLNQTASVMAHQKLNKLNLRENIEEELEGQGINRKEIVKRFKDLLYSADSRVVKEMIDMWSKWTGAYSPEKKMIMSRSEIYTEIKELPEQMEQELLEREEIQELPETDSKEELKKDTDSENSVV